MSLTITHTRRPLARRAALAHLASLSANAFEGYASLFNVADGAGDIVQPGAFAGSLRKRGAHDIRMLWQHFAQEPIGVWEEVREDSRGLYVRGRLTADVQRAREAFALLRDGAVNGLSIGFRTRRATRDARGGTRHLLEVELWEVSVVTFPLLSGSHVTAIGSESTLAASIRDAGKRIASSQ